MNKNLKKIIQLILAGLGLIFLILFLIYFKINFQHKNLIFDNSTIPSTDIGVVLGASVFSTGQPSPILQNRLDAAIELYKNDKVKKLLMSGDNRSDDYNEPLSMKNYALKNGIPEENILMDQKGLRTYETCNRLKNHFKINHAIIITQKFHLPRSLYICHKLGVNTIGFEAKQTESNHFFKNHIREFFASILAWWQLI